MPPPSLIPFNHLHCPCSINVLALMFSLSSSSSLKIFLRLMFSCWNSYSFNAIFHLRLSFHLQYFNCHNPLFSADVPTMILFRTLFGVVFSHPHVYCLVAITHFVTVIITHFFRPSFEVRNVFIILIFRVIIRCH